MERYALITGATNGLGLAYTKWLAGKGYNLIMAGRRKEVIEGRAQKIGNKYACKVIVILVDPTSEGGIRKLLVSLGGRGVHVLTNSAGSGFRTSSSDTDVDGLKRLIYLQITAMAEIVHHVLKGMRERNKGVITDILPDGAFAVVSSNVTYAASGRFIVAPTEGLHIELMGTEIRIQAMCLESVDTGSYENNEVHTGKAREGMFGFRQPEDVVDEVMKEFEKGKVTCIPGKAGELVKAMAECTSKRIYCRLANGFVNKNIRKN